MYTYFIYFSLRLYIFYILTLGSNIDMILTQDQIMVKVCGDSSFFYTYEAKIINYILSYKTE